MEHKSTFSSNQIIFKGNIERLQRLVHRENGKMLENQRFYVDVKDDKLKQHHAIPFRFHCRFRKAENGYLIRYFITPTPFGFVRMAILFALLCVMVQWRQLNPFITYGFLAVAYLINYLSQRAQCVRQFIAECSK